MDELFTVLQASCEKDVDCTLLTELADRKNVIDPFLDHKIKGHATPHLFRFFMDGDNPAMLYKEHCTKKKWKPETDLVYGFKRGVDNKWAGSQWSFQPFRGSPNLQADDLIYEIAGIRILQKSWENTQNEWETQDEHTRVLKYARLRYWTDRLNEFEKRSEKDSGTVPLQSAFWHAPMPEKKDVLPVAPHVIDSSTRKPCFVGHTNDAPKPEFKPHEVIAVNNFVVFRVPDDYVAKGCTFWIGRVMERDDNRIHVKYWTP
ncbi:hypothetical protein CBR_g34587 [Chara braunii]|uniref:DUF7869 domain-containing protein n=1 Tax=Chara braunii TaxID=69332 RepID=A0A388LJ87_CHABU|nr:hypothetical protein CBR_g34587 [Chara braunii]|eukprot:GBG82303.1 hypothetical protein CBR_g34587 [Chara braunii]